MRSYQAVLLLLAALAVFAFYYLGSGRENFSSATRRMKESSAVHSAVPDPELLLPASSAELKLSEGKSKNLESRGVQDYHLLVMFTKVDRSPGLRDKFQAALRSLVRYGKFESSEVLSLHFIADESSKEIGKSVLRDLLQEASFKYKVIFHDVGTLTEKLFPVVEAMQKLFSAGTGTYYSDSIFFLSVALHLLMPKDIARIIQLDLDLKFQTNIRELFEEFDNFLQNSVIGIAHEMQPVYRADKVRLRWSRSVKTRRGRHLMKMGGPGSTSGMPLDIPFGNTVVRTQTPKLAALHLMGCLDLIVE
ncbi:xyloside xylosyltransferase 1 isoform X2 [Ranitomeya imitator]|uniref:xyloside xylosyltransferase 1 isoform X2 n=1 Tax=Ranitomeya imitator TaxID=111125 RepID=UPI0037E8117F